MADKKLPDYPAHASGIQFINVDHAGPPSYTTGGETIGAANLQTGISLVGLSGIDNVLGASSFSISGNYFVILQPSGTGTRKTCKLWWFAVTLPAGVLTLTQVANATNLSAETVRLCYMG